MSGSATVVTRLPGSAPKFWLSEAHCEKSIRRYQWPWIRPSKKASSNFQDLKPRKFAKRLKSFRVFSKYRHKVTGCIVPGAYLTGLACCSKSLIMTHLLAESLPDSRKWLDSNDLSRDLSCRGCLAESEDCDQIENWTIGQQGWLQTHREPIPCDPYKCYTIRSNFWGYF